MADEIAPQGRHELNIINIVDHWYHEHTRLHLVDVDSDVMANLIRPLVSYGKDRETASRLAELLGAQKYLARLGHPRYAAMDDRIAELERVLQADSIEISDAV